MSGEAKFNCKQSKEMLDEYFDNEISADNRLLVEEHLAGCTSCRKELDELASCVGILKRAPQESLSVDFAENIDSIVSKAQNPSPEADALNCETARELLDEFYDRELPGDKYKTVEAHLERCDECTEALAGIHSISSLLRSVPKESLDKDYSENVEELLSPEAGKSNVVPFYKRKLALVSVAAAALLFAVISVPKMIQTGPVVADNRLPREVKVKETPQDEPQKSIANNDQVQEKEPVPVVAKQTEEPLKPVIQKEEVTSEDNAAPVKEQPKIASKTTPAPAAAQQVEQRQLQPTEVVIAYDTEEQHDLFSEMGVSTNEDGLYAIKL